MFLYTLSLILEVTKLDMLVKQITHGIDTLIILILLEIRTLIKEIGLIVLEKMDKNIS